MVSSKTENMDTIGGLSEEARSLLRCPVCRHELCLSDQGMSCVACGKSFPVLQGIPVLINENNSLFSIDDFVQERNTFFDLRPPGIAARVFKRLTPTLGTNVRGKANYLEFARLLLQESETPRVLVLGGSIIGQGMESLASDATIELVETDVSFGPRTKVICDAHDIPWADETFDGVIAQAVLEHVLDPYRCVQEIHRVLKKDGIIYAEVPFMQQVHAPPYDFTRFSYLGFRWLFRRFEEIELGICTGPGMALAWAYRYFLSSFTPRFGRLIRLFAGITAWYLKYFDYFLSKKRTALDGASGYYFLGKKGGVGLSGKDILEYYDGLRRVP